MAAVVADSSGGNPERARVMVDDPDVAARVALWTSVPEELSVAGMTAAGMTRRVLESADRAVEPFRAAHAREIESLTAAAKEMGERGLPGRKEIVDQRPARGAALPYRRPAGGSRGAGPGLSRSSGPGSGGQRGGGRSGRPQCRRSRRPHHRDGRRRCRAIPTRPFWCNRSSCAWRPWRRKPAPAPRSSSDASVRPRSRAQHRLQG